LVMPAKENNQQPIQAAPTQPTSDTKNANDTLGKVETQSEIKKD
jgi:hypothetical protein